MKTVVCFGEIMGRFVPAEFYRFSQSCPGQLAFTFGGAEANVAVSIALLGGRSAFVTALPRHAIADACMRTLAGVDVDTSHVVRTDVGRLGLYFIETGANQRPSNVIYDREGSSVSLIPPDAYDWGGAYKEAGWLHVSGITPALSQRAADATLEAARRAKAEGLSVSCDLNFRKKLWQWQPECSPSALAEKTMRLLLPYVDVLIGNEEDASDVLGIRAEGTDVYAGELSIEKYPQVAAAIAAQFPQLKKVAITLRQSLSATHNLWGAMLYDTQTRRAHLAPSRDGNYRPYDIAAIVDRVGSGDAFAAGLVFALNSAELCNDADAVAFAVAASCLAHSVKGDFNYVSKAEVLALMGGNASGRVVR